jgi:FHS family Na+ dependent glucose MFS transporter 1
MGHTPAQDSSLSDKTNQYGNLSRTAGYYAAYVALGLVTASLGPTLPGLAERTSVTLSTAGLLFSTRSLGYTLGSLYIGRTYDRITGHHVMAGMLLLMSVMLVLAPTTTLFWVLALVMFVLGAGEGTLDVGGNTLLVWLLRDEVGPFMNALHFFFGAGAFLSPIIVAQALEISGDITWAYWALALLVAPIALWLVRVPSPSAPNSDDKDTRGELRPWLVLQVAAFFFLYVGAEAGYGGWVFTYAKSIDFGSLNLTDATAAYLTSAFWGALTLGRLFSIPLAARLRPSVILFVDLVGCLLSLGTILLWPASDLALWAGSIGLGLFMASIFPTTIAFAERRMPISGRITGFFFVGVGSGAMSVPWLVGQLFEPLGPLALPYTLTAVLLLGVGVLSSLLISSSGRRASPSG